MATSSNNFYQTLTVFVLLLWPEQRTKIPYFSSTLYMKYEFKYESGDIANGMQWQMKYELSYFTTMLLRKNGVNLALIENNKRCMKLPL